MVCSVSNICVFVYVCVHVHALYNCSGTAKPPSGAEDADAVRRLHPRLHIGYLRLVSAVDTSFNQRQ